MYLNVHARFGYVALIAMLAGPAIPITTGAEPIDPAADVAENERPAPSKESENIANETVSADNGSKEALTGRLAGRSKGPSTRAPSQASQGAEQETPASGDAADAAPRSAPILDSASARITFQALLTDNNGDPLPGPTVDLEFNVYDGSGLLEGPIVMENVPIADGIVDVRVPIASSFDGSLRELGVRVDRGPELTPRMELTAVPYAFRVDRVASAELDDNIDLGSSSAGGSLSLYRTSSGGAGVTLNGAASRIQTWGANNAERIRLWGPSWGEMYLYDGSNDRTVILSATSASGGELLLSDAAGGSSVFASGAAASVSAKQRLEIVDAIGGVTLAEMVNDTTGGRFNTYDDNGNLQMFLGNSNFLPGGFGQWYQGDGDLGVSILGQAAGGGQVEVHNAAGAGAITLTGDDFGGGRIGLKNSAGQETAVLEGAGDASLTLSDDVGNLHIQLRADAPGLAGEISLFDVSGDETVEIVGAESGSQGGQIVLRAADGTTTIEIDGDFNGDGRVRTQELEITGGSDLSEQFDVHNPHGAVEPGMIVCIDHRDPGKLVVSSRPYDRTVAGIVSGAGGIEPGMYMGQKGSMADGAHPVALTGRVFALCDAAHGPIRPGDLLTTSPTAGHAMKVTDHARAHGTIIGKAMSALESGRGLVLVLVSLQ